MHYLDTSVVVAALTNEDRTPEIQAWLGEQPAGALAISDWLVTEFSSAMALKLRTGQLAEQHRSNAMSMFHELLATAFTVLPVTAADFRTAARFADQHLTGLRSGDALHLAVAAHHGATIVSLDRQLVSAATELAISAELL